MKDTKSSSVERDTHQAKAGNSDKANQHNHPEKEADIKRQQNPETSVQPEL